MSKKGVIMYNADSFIQHTNRKRKRADMQRLGIEKLKGL